MSEIAPADEANAYRIGTGGNTPTAPVNLQARTESGAAVTGTVDGGHGSLRARTGGNPATAESPIRVEHGASVNFTAVPEQAMSWTVGL